MSEPQPSFWSLEILDNIRLKCVRGSSEGEYIVECWVEGNPVHGMVGTCDKKLMVGHRAVYGNPMSALKEVVTHMCSDFDGYVSRKRVNVDQDAN